METNIPRDIFLLTCHEITWSEKNSCKLQVLLSKNQNACKIKKWSVVGKEMYSVQAGKLLRNECNTN